MRRITLATLLAASNLIVASRPASADQIYLALGDSITFGETDLRYVPSAGDRGYVSLVANSLASGNGGVRPGVVNLAIDGETASSFLIGGGRVAPVAGRTDNVLAAENTNYNPANPGSQSAKFLSTVAAQRAAGNTISTLSITLGFNDLATQVGASSSSVAAQLASYRTSYGQVLDQIRQQLPTTNLLVLGYFNPFPANPTSPAASLFNTYGNQLNGIIRDLALSHGGTFIDTAPAFVGREAVLTYIAQMPAGTTVSDPAGGSLPIGNVHPNAAGYAAIANQVLAVSPVPEPSSVALLGVGLASAAGMALRHRRIGVR